MWNWPPRVLTQCAKRLRGPWVDATPIHPLILNSTCGCAMFSSRRRKRCGATTRRARLVIRPPNGEMAEWLKAHAWKACLGETLTRVRIPLSPPVFRDELNPTDAQAVPDPHRTKPNGNYALSSDEVFGTGPV